MPLVYAQDSQLQPVLLWAGGSRRCLEQDSDKAPQDQSMLENPQAGLS